MEGLKPALGDYPQNQLKPELHQLKNVLAMIHDLVEEDDDPSDETGLARLLRKVQEPEVAARLFGQSVLHDFDVSLHDSG